MPLSVLISLVILDHVVTRLCHPLIESTSSASSRTEISLSQQNCSAVGCKKVQLLNVQLPKSYITDGLLLNIEVNFRCFHNKSLAFYICSGLWGALSLGLQVHTVLAACVLPQQTL